MQPKYIMYLLKHSASQYNGCELCTSTLGSQLVIIVKQLKNKRIFYHFRIFIILQHYKLDFFFFFY